MRLASGFWASKTLLSAVELQLFTKLGASQMTLAQVEKELNLHPRSSRDFLDALVSLNMLQRQGDEKDTALYSNTPETGLFLDKNKKSYIGGVIEMLNARLYGFWGNLTEGLQTGKPQNEAKTGDPNMFVHVYADPVKLKGFLSAMTGISTGPAMAIAAKFPFKNHKTVIDIGCAQGAVPVQLALAHPHLEVFGYDLPTVGPIFNEFVSDFGLQNRVKFIAGDFFKDATIPSADVLIMGHILHDWNLEEKKTLLKKAYAALNPSGALIVYEALIDDERRKNIFGLMMSLNMLIETAGGFDYTGADAKGWFKEVGFENMYVQHLVGPDSAVIGFKPASPGK